MKSTYKHRITGSIVTVIHIGRSMFDNRYFHFLDSENSDHALREDEFKAQYEKIEN